MRYGDKESMTLTFDEFVSMMLSPVWSSLLPADVKDEMIMRSAAMRAESPNRERVVGPRSGHKQIYTKVPI